ncbi:MAG: lipid A biosynthesis acyltransferase [Gemmataceae bacterium]|nr:lipid A biosynthesis acyltransferase [Gemmataceae bacterium]
MAKPRSWCLDYAGYLLVRMFSCVLQALPLDWSVALVRVLTLGFYHLDRRHRRVAIDNLRHAFPGAYSEEQLEQLTLDVYQHFGQMILEMTLIPRKLGSRRWREGLVSSFSPELKQALTSGRPILVVTAHYGNWELTAFMLRFFGIRAHLVARPIDNPYVDDLLRRFREMVGHKVLSKHGDLARMKEVLADRGCLCTLVDQDAGARGMFVDFFGRPASTHKVIAHLARRTGALIVVTGAQNLGAPLEYAVRTTDIIDPQEYTGHADALFAITQRVTTGVELLVRHDPRQYFWLHRRWKHSPPESAPSQAAAA